jgi:hypothetical protein
VSEQDRNIRRVRGRIGELVLAFCEARLAAGRPEFRMGELQAHVAADVAAAPASPDRILRLLRKEGRLDYEVIDRAGSLYRLLPPKRGQLTLFEGGCGR